jgi:hypothetical protein
MKAQDIKTGTSLTDIRDGRVVYGWIATGDAVTEAGMVYVPVRYVDGLDSALTFIYDAEVDVD